MVSNGKNNPVAAVHPMRQGKAPGKAPTNTATAFFFFMGVYIKAYKNKLKAATPALSQLKYNPSKATPVKPVTTANVQPSAALILPDATGLPAVRFINA